MSQFGSLLRLSVFGLSLVGIGLAQTITVNPTSLNFYHQIGQGTPAQLGFEIQSATPVTVTLAATTESGGNWLFITTLAGVTPLNVGVVVAPPTTAGTYRGNIAVAVVGSGAGPVNIPVTLIVSNLPLLMPNPASLTFNFSLGGGVPAGRIINLISTQSPIGYSAAATTSSGGPWLNVTPISGFTPTALDVSVNPAGLAVGTYNGTITIAAAGAGNSPLQIPVTLRVLDEVRLTVNPTALQFDFQIGGANPPDRAVSVSTSGLALPFTVTSATASGGAWLGVTPTSGTSPQNLIVSVNPAGLAAGTYTGTITVTAAGASGSPQAVTVTLRVTTDPLVVASPQALTFTHQVGGGAVPRQVLLVTNPGAALAVTIAAVTNTGGDWLAVTPPAATTPLAVAVTVNPGTLAAGVYTGNVRISGTFANSPLNVPITLIVSATPTLRVPLSQLNFNYQTGQTVPAARTLSVQSTGASTAFSAAATTNGGGAWLALNATTGTTPTELSVSVNPAGLVAGLYTGQVTLTPADGGAASAIIIPVRLNVAATPLISMLGNPLVFNFAVGGGAPANQTFAVDSTGAQFAYTVTAATMNGGAWLVVAPTQAFTGSTVTVGVNTLGLPEGAYLGVITIAAPGFANTPQYVPVLLTVSQALELVVPSARLVFDFVQGGNVPAARTVTVASSPAVPVAFTVTVATLSGGAWLGVTPTAGLTSTTLNVSVNPAGLEPGAYEGTITISSTGVTNSPRFIPVTLNVTRPLPNLTLGAEALTFNFTPGGSTPPAQTVALGSSGAAIPFTVAVATSTGGPWLAASPAAGSAPATLSVSVNPAGLSAGSYTGSVTISSTGAANSPRVITVTLNVASVAVPVINAFTNAASFQPTAAVPGMIVTLFGTGIGPTQLAGLTLTPQGLVDTRTGNTRVLFDGVASPMIYASSTQTSCVVPYRVAGRATVQVQVEYQGVLSNALQLRVESAAPGIFTANSSGTGNGAILNENGSFNGPSNPAPRESIIVLYATGEGATIPPGVDGQVTGATLKAPVLPVRVRIGGQEAEVLYAGSAPGLVSGALQANVRIPAGVTPGNAVAIELIIGGVSSQFGVTVAVR